MSSHATSAPITDISVAGSLTPEAQRSLAVSAVKGAIWIGGFLLALALMLSWGKSTSVNNDFTQNVWLPSRLLLDHAGPYSPTRPQVDLALGIYSQAFPGFNSGPSFHFIYPVWLAILMLPLAMLPLPLATALWRAASIVLLVWATGSLLRSTNPAFTARKPAAWFALALTAFLCFIFRADVLNLFLGQFAVMELALLVAIWAWLHRSGAFSGRRLVLGDALTGVALAVLATKPQVTGLALLLIVLWAVSRRRFVIPASAAASLGLLLFVPLLFYPSSLGDWLSVILHGQATSQTYVSASVWGLSYNLLGGGSPLWVVVALVLSAVGVGLLLPLWRRDMLNKTAPVPAALPLTLCMNSVLSPYMLGYEHVLLLLPALVVLASLGVPGMRDGNVPPEPAGARLLRLAMYIWLGVLPLLTALLQVVAGKDYPVVVQAGTMLGICWWVGKSKNGVANC